MAAAVLYTLSLLDALPISSLGPVRAPAPSAGAAVSAWAAEAAWPSTIAANERHSHEVTGGDRKSTRLNSSHSQNSYAVFCLKKKQNRLNDTVGSKKSSADK